MISYIFNYGIITLSVAFKTALLAFVLHILFLPLMLHLIPLNQGSTMEVAGIGLLIQMILFGIIMACIFTISTIILFLFKAKLYQYSVQQITTAIFPVIAVAYIATFCLAIMLFERDEIPFVIACSIPHLISISTGVFLLVSDWKVLSESATIPMSNITQG